jgi:hypothetical protein|tara:strand:- start:78 stop:266 length:189 start_codon:yes stop_codon:yes gene_type:complete
MPNMQERHEAYMTRRIREEDAELGNIVAYNNVRLTKELEELKERIKILETDMAYTQKVELGQ